jgi:hypothetical protein
MKITLLVVMVLIASFRLWEPIITSLFGEDVLRSTQCRPDEVVVFKVLDGITVRSDGILTIDPIYCADPANLHPTQSKSG